MPALTVLVTAFVTAVAGVVVGAASASAAPAGAPVAAYPAPGSVTALPQTTLTLRGATAAPGLTVTGSASGGHTGTLAPLPGGRGLTFTPDAPFAAGEEVTVASGLPVTGAAGGTWSFRVATPEKHPGVTADGQLATGPAPTGPAATSTAAAAGQVQAQSVAGLDFQSRPDLNAPDITTTTSGTPADGLLFATPMRSPDNAPGLVVYDDDGEIVWYRPVTNLVVGDLSVQSYQGQPVMTWFQGTAPFGPGNYRGEWVVVDSSYQEVTRIRMGNGYQADIHDMVITDDGTALLMAYSPILCDGVSVTGCTTGRTVLDAVVQEVDIATGAVLFEWHGIDQVSISESYAAPGDNPLDYIHPNSLDLDTDGNVLMSARLTSTLYKIDRTTGEIIWRFGGKASDFTYAAANGATIPAAVLATGPDFQHDLRPRGNSSYSYFDNGNRKKGPSYGAFVTLDTATGVATYTKALSRPAGALFGPTQGKLQPLPGGHNLVAWGGLGIATEYDAADAAVFESDLGAGSYRQVRAEWTGAPVTRPDAVVVERGGGSVDLAVSWNGDTRTQQWRVLTGATPDTVTTPLTTVPRSGFETAVTATNPQAYVALQALDGGGNAVPGGTTVVFRADQVFTETASVPVGGTYTPLVGDFGGSRNDDVLYYAPGSGADFLHVADGAGGFTSYRLPTIGGAYQPVVGDFVGDDRDEVIWRTPGSTIAYMWRFDRAARSAAPVTQSASLRVPATVTKAIVLDERPSYGGPNKDGVFWYAAGAAPERLDRWTWVAGKPLTVASTAFSIGGSYRPATGDFDGNGYADIFWHGPGTAPDYLWYGTGNAFRQVGFSVTGSYQPIAGHLLGDARTDQVLFYAPGTPTDGLWSLRGTTATTYDVSTTGSGGAYLLSGPADSVLLWSNGVPKVWGFRPGETGLTSTGNSAVPSGYRPLVGDFVGAGGASSVLWYRPGADPELLWTP